MSDSANIGRADRLRAGRCTAPNAPLSGARPGILLSHLCLVEYGGGDSPQGYNDAPIAKAANNICLAQAKLSAGSLTLNGSLVTGGEAVLPEPRNIQVDSSNAGDTTQTVTVTGLDAVGNAQVEEIAMNGTTNVFGNMTFSKVTDVSVSAALAGNITIGIGDRVGLPFKVKTGSVILINEDGVISAPTINGLSSTNGLGSFTPATIPDGSVTYQVLCNIYDSTESAYDVPISL